MPGFVKDYDGTLARLVAASVPEDVTPTWEEAQATIMGAIGEQIYIAVNNAHGGTWEAMGSVPPHVAQLYKGDGTAARSALLQLSLCRVAAFARRTATDASRLAGQADPCRGAPGRSRALDVDGLRLSVNGTGPWTAAGGDHRRGQSAGGSRCPV